MKLRKSSRPRFARRAILVLIAGLVFAVAVERAAPSRAANGPTPPSEIDRIVIVKSTHTMALLSHGRVVRTYKVALGRGGGKPKTRAGDQQTPEGDYIIDGKNPHSRFHLALRISYPNARDQEQARKLGVDPGTLIEIHGIEEKWAWLGSLHRQTDWTEGCIAVTNPEIEEIYKLVPVGTPIQIRANAKPMVVRTTQKR